MRPHTKSKRAHRKYEARRRPLAGFPVNVPFNSIVAVREYMNEPEILCLLCGRKFKKLGGHITRVHEISVDDYREKYNIPWTYGLLTKDSKTCYAGAMNARREKGFRPPDCHQVEMIAAKKRLCPFKVEIAMQHLAKINK